MLSSILHSATINIAFRIVLSVLFLILVVLCSILAIAVAIIFLILLVFGYVYFDEVDNEYKVKIPYLTK